MTNLNGGVFDISGDGTALLTNYTGTFDNQPGAIFRKSAGTGTSNVYWAFNNSGDVQGQVCTLKFISGGAYGGTSTVYWTFNNSGLVEATIGVLSFTGGFTQSATGDLRVDGATIALAGSPTLQGNLSGSGTIQASTLTQSNGAISPGLSAGTLAFSGTLNLDSTSMLNFELGSASDLITVGGGLTLDGVLNVTATGGFGPGTYPLIDYTGTLTDNGLTLGALPGGYSYSLVTDLPNTRIVLDVVPEPSALALLGLAVGLAGLWGWRRRIHGRHHAHNRRGG